MRNLWRRIKWEHILICLVIVLFGLCLTGNLYGFYIMPDEYTYWSYAAYAAGYDWSETVALGPYFSYGYSVLLYPFFMFFGDSVTAYRMAVRINFIFLALVYVLLERLGRRFAEDKRSLTGYAAVCIFFPCYFFYAQTTMTETLILLLYLVVCTLLYDYLEKDRSVTLILLTAAVMYLYIVHMRTVGVLVSIVPVLGMHFYRDWAGNGKKHLILCVSMITLLFVAASIIKDKTCQEIYRGINQELVTGNDYGGQLEKIRYILTWNGFCDFLISLMGKVLYLGLASFGLFYFGIVRLINKAKRNLLSMEGFVLLTVGVQIGISTIYLLTLGEICDYTYGRYNEFVLLIPMLYGISELREMAQGRQYKNIVTTAVWIAVMQLAATVVIVRQTVRADADNFQGFFITGIGYLYQEENFTVETFYRNAYLFNTALMAVVVGTIVLSGIGARRVLLYGIVVLEMCLSVRLYQIYQKPYRIGAYRDVSIADGIGRLYEEEYEIYYLDSTYPASVGMIQFLQREIPIHVLYDKQCKPEPKEKVLYIMDYEDARYDEWKLEYKYYDMYGHFAILYN